MGQEYDFETREQAEELYVVDGLTFEQVAQRTGVSATQLKNWSAAEKWREKRQEYRASLKDIKSNMAKMRSALARKAVQSLDPQDIYAFVRLEKIAGKGDRTALDGAQIDKPAFFLESLEFIAGILKEKDPEGLKVLARNFDDLVGAFKARYAEAT